MHMLWFVVSLVSLLLIFITMLCRANDLRWRKGFVWQVRLIGFIICGTTPIGIIATEFMTSTWPSPYESVFRMGLAFVFVTTPHLPPWWRWVSGKEEAADAN